MFVHTWQFSTLSSGCHVLTLHFGQSQFLGGLENSCAHLGHLARKRKANSMFEPGLPPNCIFLFSIDTTSTNSQFYSSSLPFSRAEISDKRGKRKGTYLVKGSFHSTAKRKGTDITSFVSNSHLQHYQHPLHHPRQQHQHSAQLLQVHRPAPSASSSCRRGS